MVAKFKVVLRRLETMKRFQEITKAIRFITGGELAKVRKEINRRFAALGSFIPLFARKYTTFDVSINNTGRADLDFETSELSSETINNGVLVIPFTDDRGNCGAHNSMVLAYTATILDNLNSNGIRTKLYPIGLKARNFCEDYFKEDIIGSITELGETRMKLDICFFYVEYFMSKNFNAYYLLFNRFWTMEEQFITMYRLCNFTDFLNSIVRNSFSKYGIYYDAIITRALFPGFLEDLYIFGFSMFLLEAFCENKYSFLGARYTAMDEMVNNSQEIIEKLTLIYNKLRQEHITTEMIEIISAKNAVMEL